MGRRVYIHPADGYLGRSLGPLLTARGYEVLGGYNAAEAPTYLSCSYQVGSNVAVAAKRQFLAVADVVIFELHGHEQAARDAVVHMAKQPFGGRQQLFLAVSTPLVWAATRPAPPEEQIAEDVDVPDSASELAAAAAGHAAMEGNALDKPRTSSRPGSVCASIAGRSRTFSAAPSMTLRSVPSTPPSPPDAYALAAAAGALTDRDASRRAPCLSARAVHELEQLVVRCQRKGKLRTAVVCPGLMYGNGEMDMCLHPLIKAAWELQEPLKIYGGGTNHLPMIHVDDCAAYLTALCGSPHAAATTTGSAASGAMGTAAGGPAAALLAGLPDSMQYLLVADCAAPGAPGGVQQGQLIQELATRLGTGETITVPPEQLLFTPRVEQWTLNTPFACTPLPASAAYTPQYSEGILAHLDTVLQQWRQARGVTPLRVVLSGPPMAGKSTVAARLSQLYRVPHFTAKDLLAAVHLLPADEAKAITAELSSKEGRASAKSMASLLRAMLAANKTATNRGYVLDAFPKTAGQARWAFMKVVQMTPQELKEKKKDEEAERAASSLGAKGAKSGTPVKKEKGKGASGLDGPDVPEGHKLSPDTTLAPTHLIQVEADTAELSARRAVVEMLEQEAARAALASAEGGPNAAKGKAGKDKDKNNSHNVEKEYNRRAAAWAQWKQEEQQDLTAQVAAAQAKWERQQAEREAQRLQAEMEACTLRARRRRAREAAAAASSDAADGLGPADDGQQQSPSLKGAQQVITGSTALQQGASLQETQQGPAGGGTEACMQEGTAESSEAAVQAAQGPMLPQFGGLPGVLVTACGARHLQLHNPDKPGGAPVVSPADWVVADEGGQRLRELEQALKHFFGPPHNFEGFPAAPAEALHGSNGGDADARQALEQAAAKQRAEAAALQLQQQHQEALQQAACSLAAKHALMAQPLRNYVMARVMPCVTEALRVMCIEQPQEPLRFLADHLLAEASRLESQHVEPYSHPQYEVQRNKHREKQAREAARALAAQQKADKELAAKQAARQTITNDTDHPSVVLTRPVSADTAPALEAAAVQ